MLVPLYQNLHNLFYTLLFIVLYTLTLSKPRSSGNMDFVEGVLYAFAFGFLFDGITKMSPYQVVHTDQQIPRRIDYGEILARI